MTPKGFVRAFFSYSFGSLASVIFALVLWALLREWFEGLRPWLTVGGVWLIVVGVPSCGWAAQNISKTLGVKPQPRLQVNGWRTAPISGTGSMVTDAIKSVLPIAHPEPERGVTLPEEYAFLFGSYVFPESQVKDLLRAGWKRQRAGRSAFSRVHWIDKEPFWGDRLHYDSWMAICEAAGFLVNRSKGHSGKLIHPPLLALSELRFQCRRVRIT